MMQERKYFDAETACQRDRAAQEVFVAELAGMYLNGDVTGQLAIEPLIHFNDLFRGDRFCEINLGFPENSS